MEGSPQQEVEVEAPGSSTSKGSARSPRRFPSKKPYEPASTPQATAEETQGDMSLVPVVPVVPPPPSPHEDANGPTQVSSGAGGAAQSTTSRASQPKLGEAIKKFPSQQQGDLNLNVGDRVVITKYDPSRNWWRGYLQRDRNCKGIFPKDFVKTLGPLDDYVSPRGRAPTLPARDGPPVLPSRDAGPPLPPWTSAESTEGAQQKQQQQQQQPAEVTPAEVTLMPARDGASADITQTPMDNTITKESTAAERAGAPTVVDFVDTDGDGVAYPWEGGLCFRGPEFATVPEPQANMPKSFQNVGAFGVSDKRGMYCTAVPDVAQLPKLPDGFAYDFVPRGHGYTVDRIGDPQNPIDNCRLMLNSCVCCVCCNECFEPQCCDLDALGEAMVSDQVDASNCHTDMSLWQLGLQLRFLPCYATLATLPCWSCAEPCLDSCSVCGPFLCGEPVSSVLDCIPCLDDLVKCQVPCFFSCWSCMPYSCKCRPCEGCRGQRCDPAAWCTGCACQCYVCALIPACPLCCYNCPKCPRCPQITCPGCPNCCPCLKSCITPAETTLVCCGKEPCCGCLFRSHYCHPKAACCLCCGRAVERVPGVHGEGWASPFLTQSNFHYKDHIDFRKWSSPDLDTLQENDQKGVEAAPAAIIER